MRIPLPASFGVVLSSALTVACAGSDTGSAGGAGGAFTLADSAGVAIAESRAPVWEAGDGWTVGAEPALRIGALSGEQEYQLFEIRGVTRLEDGRIVVANGDQTIRFYDEGGSHLRSVGREGEGPGEFMFLRSIQRLEGDTVFAWDSRLRRATLVTPEGELLGGEPFPRGIPITGIMRRPGGAYFGTALSRDTAFTRSGGHVQWPWRQIVAIQGVDPPLADTLFRYPSNERYVASPEPQQEPQGGAPDFEIISVVPGRVSAPASRFVGVPVARQGVLAFAGDRVLVGGNDRVDIREFDGGGALIRVIRVPGLDRPIDEAVADSLRGFLFDWTSTDTERERLEGILSDVSFPEVLPSFSAIHVATDGHVWLAPYVMPVFAPEERGPETWQVLDPEGRWLGPVTLPARFTPIEFGPDYILGVWRDEYDVEYVDLLEIAR